MKITSVAVAAALVAVIPFVAIPAQAAEPQAAANKETTTEVKEALSETNLKKDHLKVKTTGKGNVAVSGNVKNLSEVHKAMDTTAAVNGVDDAKVSGTFSVDHLPPATPIKK